MFLEEIKNFLFTTIYAKNQKFTEKMRNIIMPDNKKVFTRKASNDVLTSETVLDLIDRKDESVWVMNHIFINPDQHDEHEISLLMDEVMEFIKDSNKKIWPLDPIAIIYFEQHSELTKYWYHKPANK